MRTVPARQPPGSLSRKSRLGASLAWVGLCMLAPARADSNAELEDAAARLQYAFYTADSRSLEEVLALIARLEVPSTLQAMKEYYGAYGNWKLAQLYVEDPVRDRVPIPKGAVGKAAQACEMHSEAALKLDPNMEEAHAILAICSATGQWPRSLTGCARKSLRTARQLKPANPRVMLIDVLCSEPDDAASTALFDKLRAVVVAFETAAPSRPGQPDWGQAEALVLLGQNYLQRGDALAARDVIERALVLAPDYRKAQELLKPAAARPR